MGCWELTAPSPQGACDSIPLLRMKSIRRKGPDRLNGMFVITLRFNETEIALTTSISKMYDLFHILLKDLHVHRLCRGIWILIDTSVMNVHAFGERLNFAMDWISLRRMGEQQNSKEKDGKSNKRWCNQVEIGMEMFYTRQPKFSKRNIPRKTTHIHDPKGFAGRTLSTKRKDSFAKMWQKGFDWDDELSPNDQI